MPLALLGIAGALLHNVGQLLAAAFWLGTLDVFCYAPMLFALAVFTGFATGFLAQEILRRLPWRNKKNSQKL